ncbi:hypothetical protein T484DRAFT_1918410, partial [Baffinella frigidus]
MARRMLFFLAASCLILQGSPSAPGRSLDRQPPKPASTGSSGTAAGGWRGGRGAQRKVEPQETQRVPAVAGSGIRWMRGGEEEGVPAADAAEQAGSPRKKLRPGIARLLSAELEELARDYTQAFTAA